MGEPTTTSRSRWWGIFGGLGIVALLQIPLNEATFRGWFGHDHPVFLRVVVQLSCFLVLYSIFLGLMRWRDRSSKVQ
jgi:hypothetical protein